MSELKAPSLNSLLESDVESLLADSLQFEPEDLDDVEYNIPPPGDVPTLESVLNEFETDSDIASELGMYGATPTPNPSIAEECGVRGGGAGGGGSVMRYGLLQGVSAQVASAAERVNAGLASSCAVSALIAVGTSHGHILNFEVTQTLRWAHQDKHGQGAVSTLAYNPDCSRLLAGYARGLIIMLDTHTGNVLRSLFDVVTPNSGVLHVKWTSRSNLALCADSGGSVWSLNFTRKLGIRSCSSRCLFSGARGEVCAVEPLIMDGVIAGQESSAQDHDLDQYCIVALATLSKYFIVTVRPRLKVIKYHALQGPSDCLPILAWQMVLIQAADTTRSVDPVIVVGRGNQIFFHQLFMANGRISLLYLRHIQLQANLLSTHWLGPKCVGCLDTSEILHLFDVRTSKEIECMDLANVGLVYGSAQFKGLATGGNVSPALALAGTHACYNSIASCGSQLYVLGAKSLHMIGVRSWTERIVYLVRNHRWQEACEIALEGYRSAAQKPKRRAHAKERIIMLFREYLAASARAPDYCLAAIINCLISIGEYNLLWNELWERMRNSSSATFLQLVSEHIEQEHIREVNPDISQALVDFWLKVSPSTLENLILKLNWTCLDLNQVLKAAKHHRLYKVQLYLNTNALKDYSISLVELIPLIQTEHPDLGNTLLVYISSCLAGRGYPSGDVPPEDVQNVKHEVLRCLTSQHSTKSEPNELPYPYLRALLQFDTRETLNVISLAFQEKEFSGELGYSHRKRIINMLLEIMTPENATWAEVGCLLNFIAQQISMQSLPYDKQLLCKVLNYLAMEEIANETSRQHGERESAWHELLVNNCLSEISTDEEQLAMARKANCLYVVEYLLEKLERYGEIVECYILNSTRHDTMFSYIERHAHCPERKIYDQIKAHLMKLLDINSAEVARIMQLHFPTHIEKLFKTLNTKFVEGELAALCYLQSLHARHMSLPSVLAEEFLELLCKHKPEQVMEFLENKKDFDTNSALEVVEKFENQTASAIYLYEQLSNFAKSFQLSLDMLGKANQEDAEKQTYLISGLCARASAVLPANESEKLWFELLKATLPREDLKSITKTLLHEASLYVDLHSLVQLVMNTRNVSGSFGDIKELLMSMLINSRYDIQALEQTMALQAGELHKQFADQRKESCRGLWVTMPRCVVCHQKLSNPHMNVIVMGSCSHAMHEHCVELLHAKAMQNGLQNNEHRQLAQPHNNEISTNENDDGNSPYKCPRCDSVWQANFITNTMHLSNPSQTIFTHYDEQNVADLGTLNLKAAPQRRV